LWSVAAGVGHQGAHPGCFCIDGQSWFAVAGGVAYRWRFTTLARLSPREVFPSVANFNLSTTASNFGGVGQYPDSLATVGSPCVVSSQHTPSSIIPQRGKVTEDHGKSSSNKHR